MNSEGKNPEEINNEPPQKKNKLEVEVDAQQSLSLENNTESTTEIKSTMGIASINLYVYKWNIVARIISKTPIKYWANAKGQGSFFSVNLKDATGEIKATAFRDECEKFFPLLELNKTYSISNCAVKVSNKQFTSIKHDYELTFTKETTVAAANDSNIPGIEYTFTEIKKLGELPVGHLVDIIGVCKFSSECIPLTSRATGRELKKRIIELVDNSKHSIPLTLWDQKAQDFDGSGQPVVIVTEAKITDFQNSRGLSTTMSSIMLLNPEVERADHLRQWYNNGGQNETFTNVRIGNLNVEKEAFDNRDVKLCCSDCGSSNIRIENYNKESNASVMASNSNKNEIMLYPIKLDKMLEFGLQGNISKQGTTVTAYDVKPNNMVESKEVQDIKEATSPADKDVVEKKFTPVGEH